METDDIKVSVCCLVYNHEKYLRKCLDGFIMQKTNFKYEVLIHDDASTDRSAEIIREYELRYPDIIKPIFQMENQYSQKVSIFWTYQLPRVKGKYIAICEGDDYWTDENKLQKQYDAMENDPRAVFCTHTVCVVSERGRDTGRRRPPDTFQKAFMTSDEWIQSLLTIDHFFHTSSFFFTTSVIQKWLRHLPDFCLKYPTGDVKILMLFATEGGVVFLKEAMSCYRSGSAGSWTSRFLRNPEMRERIYTATLESLNAYDDYTEHQYSKEIDIARRRTEMALLQERGNYWGIRSPQYSDIYAKMSAPAKMKLFIRCHFPRLLYWYRMLKLKM